MLRLVHGRYYRRAELIIKQQLQACVVLRCSLLTENTFAYRIPVLYKVLSNVGK